MTSYAAVIPRVTLKITTGGRRLVEEKWKSAMFYVRASNAWPVPYEEE